MISQRERYYPTTLEAIHLLVLYIFLQSLVDFPLALYDYNHDTRWLENFWIGSISSIAITLFIFIYGFKKSQQPFAQVFGLKLFNPLLIVPVAIMLPGMQYLVGLLNTEVDKILPAPPWFWELFERVLNHRFGFWGSVLKVAVIAPVVEETLFRGIIMHGLMKNYKPWYAILLSGILFSLFHLNPWQMTYTFFLGLLLGWLMVKTRSLPLCILTHSLNNLIVLMSIVWEKQLREHPLYSLSQSENILLGSALVLFGIVLIILIPTIFKSKTGKSPG